MVVLIGCSAFFSASEAALFYLRSADRRALATGNPAQRVAASLLADPEHLLTAVLFWNLVTNIAYFAIASICSLSLERNPGIGGSGAATFALLSLMTIIFFSEMLPKSLAVLSARTVATLVGVPLTATVRLVDPILPALRLANLLSRRLIWPHFQAEPYLEVSDLERAIELSTSDSQLVEQEQAVLRNIVVLSDIRVDELMRPRMQFVAFRPPVSLADLEGQIPSGGYLLVTEPDSDEVASAIDLKELSDIPRRHLEHHAEPVLYVPWCTTAADALQQMKTRDRDVAAVVNELGETIGILTLDDVLDTIFTYDASRSARLLNRRPIQPAEPGLWHATGMTSLRRLGRYFNVELPVTRSVTVAGIVQQKLQHLPGVGDACRWGPFQFKVIDAPERGQMMVQLSRTDDEERAT